MIRSNCEKAYSHVQALRKKQYLPDNYYWDHMWNYHYYLSLAEWYDKNTDATVAHVEPAYAYSDTLAKYDVDYAPTHVQRSTNFINLYFEYCNLPQGDRYVEPARQFAHKLIDFLRVSNLADSTKLQQFNYLNRMKLYFDNFSPKSRDYLHLLYQIFNLENQINANQYSPQNYQTSKTVISLIDKALFIKKDDAFLMQTKASHLGGLAWFSILSRNYEQAEQAAKNGLELAPSETWIYSNLAAAYLLLGKFEEAKKIYTQYADAPADPLHVRTMRTIFLNDLDQFEQMGITHKDFKKVKGLLQK
ncbi:MAG: tetratricopeptide repeat protein [Saprospiraceae bacterium]|nr:tetratricopeptide repeat protein [Saprospiraceae bacterium]